MECRLSASSSCRHLLGKGMSFLLPGIIDPMATPLDYDPNTPGGMVRLRISDVTEPVIFSDAEIQAFLAMSRDSVLRASAAALLAIAANETLLLKYLRTDDLTVDGVKGATELRLQARQLTSEADSEEEFFMISYPECGDTYPRGLEYEEHYHGGW